MNDKTRTHRVRMFAAKWLADEHTEEPTDEALQAAFRPCSRPAKPELYPAIRETIAHWDELMLAEYGPEGS